MSAGHLTPPPWPTADQLERAGFVRCSEQPCPVYLDPVNVPAARCSEHRRRRRSGGRPQRNRTP